MELIKKIQQIGFSKREAEIYLALLNKKEFTAPELAKITTVTRTKVYEVLQKLVHRGMCKENISNGQKYFRAVKPDIIFKKIILDYEANVEKEKQISAEQQKRINAEIQKKILNAQKRILNTEKKNIAEYEKKKLIASTVEKELTALYLNNYSKEDSIDYIEVLTDVNEIRTRWIDIIKKTKNQLLIFTKPPYSISFEDNLDYEANLIKNKKAVIKCIYEYDSNIQLKEREKFIELLEKYESIGEEVRLIKNLPMKLAISDNSITLLALNDRISMKSSITTMIVNHPSFANALEATFQGFWEKATPLKSFKKKMKLKN